LQHFPRLSGLGRSVESAHLEGHRLLFGFSDIDNALLLIDPSTGVATEVDSAISLMDIEGIVFLKGSLDPKATFD